MRTAVVALLADPRVERELAAGFEEEDVPLALETASGGDAVTLARAAAASSSLGIGIGADPGSLAAVLAAFPGRAYVTHRPTGDGAGVRSHRRPRRRRPTRVIELSPRSIPCRSRPSALRGG